MEECLADIFGVTKLDSEPSGLVKVWWCWALFQACPFCAREIFCSKLRRFTKNVLAWTIFELKLNSLFAPHSKQFLSSRGYLGVPGWKVVDSRVQRNKHDMVARGSVRIDYFVEHISNLWTTLSTQLYLTSYLLFPQHCFVYNFYFFSSKFIFM